MTQPDQQPTPDTPSNTQTPVPVDSAQPATSVQPSPSVQQSPSQPQPDQQQSPQPVQPSQQPEYGVLASDLGNGSGLEYGAMSSQFPAGYNPYIYGAPEPPTEQQTLDTNDADARRTRNQQFQQGQQRLRDQQQAQQPRHHYNPEFYPFGLPDDASNNQPTNQQGANPDSYRNAYGPGMYMGPADQPNGPNGQQPGRYRNGINLDDPNQNPVYGHWDAYSIIAFVFTLIFPCPVLPAIMGALAMWRTKTFHMKGFGFGVAALVINTIYTIAFFWMMANGVSPTDVLNQMNAMLDSMRDSTDSLKA
ncbi:hypothetical protein [Bifidobacterium gallicum]|nr:hypothetical protein [Bifidobacterium gallicum]KFI58855.1 hypothetical protein BGLCM_1150 [Bifidobacterium gallicum DSM 20093 = LMG 11596]